MRSEIFILVKTFGKYMTNVVEYDEIDLELRRLRKELDIFEKAQLYDVHEEVVPDLDSLRMLLRDNLYMRTIPEKYLELVDRYCHWLMSVILNNVTIHGEESTVELLLALHTTRQRPIILRVDRNRIVIGPFFTLLFLDAVLNHLPKKVDEYCKESNLSRRERCSKLVDVLRSFESRLSNPDEVRRSIRVLYINNVDVNYEEDLEATLLLEIAEAVRTLYETASIDRSLGRDLLRDLVAELVYRGYLSMDRITKLANTYREYVGLIQLKQSIKRSLAQRKTLQEILKKIEEEEREREAKRPHEEAEEEPSREEAADREGEEAVGAVDVEEGGEGSQEEPGAGGGGVPVPDVVRDLLSRVEFELAGDFLRTLEGQDASYISAVRNDFACLMKLLEDGVLTREDVRQIIRRHYHPRSCTLKMVRLNSTSIELTDSEVEALIDFKKLSQLLASSLAYTGHGKEQTSAYLLTALEEKITSTILSAVVTSLRRAVDRYGSRVVAEKILRGEFEISLL